MAESQPQDDYWSPKSAALDERFPPSRRQNAAYRRGSASSFSTMSANVGTRDSLGRQSSAYTGGRESRRTRNHQSGAGSSNTNIHQSYSLIQRSRASASNGTSGNGNPYLYNDHPSPQHQHYGHDSYTQGGAPPRPRGLNSSGRTNSGSRSFDGPSGRGTFNAPSTYGSEGMVVTPVQLSSNSSRRPPLAGAGSGPGSAQKRSSGPYSPMHWNIWSDKQVAIEMHQEQWKPPAPPRHPGAPIRASSGSRVPNRGSQKASSPHDYSVDSPSSWPSPSSPPYSRPQVPGSKETAKEMPIRNSASSPTEAKLVDLGFGESLDNDNGGLIDVNETEKGQSSRTSLTKPKPYSTFMEDLINLDFSGLSMETTIDNTKHTQPPAMDAIVSDPPKKKTEDEPEVNLIDFTESDSQVPPLSSSKSAISATKSGFSSRTPTTYRSLLEDDPIEEPRKEASELKASQTPHSAKSKDDQYPDEIAERVSSTTHNQRIAIDDHDIEDDDEGSQDEGPQDDDRDLSESDDTYSDSDTDNATEEGWCEMENNSIMIDTGYLEWLKSNLEQHKTTWDTILTHVKL
ncbi:hypothetical protein BGW38_000161 [Lunasporangiospora selenospora]|uniref:Uncharacterized protein n=1 Tax=Lunasporangiospora selenospora TaxID=979761 RepID=A0A9P6KF08_9FUNG|nr:hypothetical protein BGW38_000161 [Lunasporangiospora selenospora]